MTANTACKACEGTGINEWQENASPHGSGYSWNITWQEPCPECVEKDLCPHCGAAKPDATTTCATCNWSPDEVLLDLLRDLLPEPE